MAFVGGAEVQELVAVLRLKDQFSGTATKISKSISTLDKDMSKVSTRAFKAGQQIGTGIKNAAYIAAGAIGFLATNVALGINSLQKLEKSQAQTNAVLKSTQGVAGITAKAVGDLAEKYESLNATIGDEVIRSSENLLLTFTNIRKDAFEPTLQAILDMNAAMGGDENSLKSVTIQVGKALQDPIKGITALRKVGVNFSADQLKVIKRLVETGDTLGAQKLILAELNKEFGGSFLAQGNTTAGKVAKFRDAIEDLQRVLATALLPVIGKVADGLSKFLADPAVIRGAKDIGDAIAGLFSDENLAAGADFLKGAFETAKEAAPIVRDAAKATFSLVQSAVGLFRSLPPEVQKLAVGAFAINKLTGGLVTNLAGGLISAVLKQLVSGVVNVQGATVIVNGGIGGAAGAAAGGAGVLGKAASIASKVFIVGLAAEAASLLAKPVVDLGKNIHDGIFGANGDPLSDFGKAWTDWRKNADWPFGQKNAPEWAGGSAPEKSIGLRVKPLEQNLDIRRLEAAENRTGNLINAAGQTIGKQIGATTWAVRATTKALRDARGSKQIAAAVKSSLATIFSKGLGGSGGAENTLKALKAQLKNTHDPALQRVLQSAIRRVETKIVARKVVENQLKKADQIYKSNLTNAQKIERLKQVQQTIGGRNAIATKRVQEKIDAARKAQVKAQAATTAAVKSKDLSVAIKNVFNAVVNVTNRATATTQAIQNRYYNVPT